jgi:hypothetical protein
LAKQKFILLPAHSGLRKVKVLKNESEKAFSIQPNKKAFPVGKASSQS